MHQRSRKSASQPIVCSFRLAGESDVTALSRFAHQVVNGDLCPAEVVVVELATGVETHGSVVRILDVVIGCLTRKHILPVVIAPAPEVFDQIDRRSCPHLDAARIVASKGDAALLILDGTRRVQ